VSVRIGVGSITGELPIRLYISPAVIMMSSNLSQHRPPKLWRSRFHSHHSSHHNNLATDKYLKRTHLESQRDFLTTSPSRPRHRHTVSLPIVEGTRVEYLQWSNVDKPQGAVCFSQLRFDLRTQPAQSPQNPGGYGEGCVLGTIAIWTIMGLNGLDLSTECQFPRTIRRALRDAASWGPAPGPRFGAASMQPCHGGRRTLDSAESSTAHAHAV